LTIQLAASATLLFLLIQLRGGFNWSPQLRRLAILGVLNPGASYALGLAGLTMITASLSVVLWATEPLMILLLAAWLLHEEVTGATVLALLAATFGVSLVLLDPATSGSLLGVALSIAGVAACAIYTVTVRKWMSEESTIEAVSAQQLSALAFAIGILLVDLVVPGGSAWGGWSSAAWLSAIGSGILYYAIAFWFYLAGLRKVPAAVAGTFLTLIPIFGVAGGYLFLGERLGGRQGIGALLIVVSVGALVRGRRSRALTTEPLSIIVDGR
jgi:drug/metabolite transporter (DMT)-like permease